MNGKFCLDNLKPQKALSWLIVFYRKRISAYEKNIERRAWKKEPFCQSSCKHAVNKPKNLDSASSLIENLLNLENLIENLL